MFVNLWYERRQKSVVGILSHHQTFEYAAGRPDDEQFKDLIPLTPPSPDRESSATRDGEKIG